MKKIKMRALLFVLAISFLIGNFPIIAYGELQGYELAITITAPASDRFMYPWAVATDSTGIIYVAAENGSRIEKYDQNGVFLDSWNMSNINYVCKICLDISGNV